MSRSAENDAKPSPYATREDIARLSTTVVGAVSDIQASARGLEGVARETRSQLDAMRTLATELQATFDDFRDELRSIKKRLRRLEEHTGLRKKLQEEGTDPNLKKP